MNITRRKILGGLALTAVPATAVAAIPQKVEIVPPSLEERLAKMDPNDRAEWLAGMLANTMREISPGAWDVRLDPSDNYVHIGKRQSPGELEDYYMDRLIEVLEYNTSGLYRSTRLTPGGYTQVLLTDRRGALGTIW